MFVCARSFEIDDMLVRRQRFDPSYPIDPLGCRSRCLHAGCWLSHSKSDAA
jgi:hypothetical protein